ncbi:uncharacterized protein LOC117111126 [Anneissia japonica]|uniref:uncharacterized protein LOC117111126 n=1 Tax=Anneissia japonica TaxID=1529436 RepID=UPI0014259C18|nr:uncharacterized protein LOC117111126 [Anneissia japonica]
MDICPQHQTCQGRCGNPPTNQSVCNCDSHCQLYGDCCYDYWTNCTVNNTPSPSQAFWDRTACTDSYRFYLISKCSPNTIDFVNWSKCEKPNPDDLLQNIPVSDSFNIAYYNVFCALCNGVPILDVVAWEIIAQCRYANIGYNSHLLTATMAPTTPIGFRNILSDIDRAEECYYEYQPVGNLSKRHCSNEYGFTHCPMHYPDEEVANYCKMYRAPVHENGVVYANPHCARCHGILSYFCKNVIPDTPDFLLPEGEIIPIAILVDFSSGSVSVESPSEKFTSENVDCGLGRVYNPFNDKCIETVCEQGKVSTEIGCIELIEFSFAVAVPVPTENPSGQTIEFLCSCNRSSIVQVRYNANNESIQEQCITEMTSLIQGYDTFFDVYHFGTSNSLILFETLECQLLNEVHTLIYQQSHSNHRSLLKNITFTEICENENMISLGVGRCDNQFFNINTLNVTKQREGFIVTDENNNFIITAGDYQVKMTYIIASNTTLITLRIANCSYSTTCPLVALDIIDFYIFNNDTWVYKPTGRQFKHDEITIMFNDSVLVCSFFSQNGTRTFSVTLFVYEDNLQVVNLVGVSCSLLGLFLTLVVYCTPKKRETYSGTIVINIALSLFLAQLMTLFAEMVTTQSKLVCTVFAALLHYLWLVAFMWMFLMSLTLFKSFRSFKSSLDSRHQNQSIKCFALGFGWGVPFGFVAILLTLHFCDCVDLPFNFVYGDDTVCWIRDEFSVFLFLGIPMSIILFVNGSLFIATAYGIYRSKKHSKKILRDLKKKNIIENLIIYAKISCIVGLTWIFGFLSLFIDEPVFWYTFIILNSMQGVFIFFSFSATTIIEALMKK